MKRKERMAAADVVKPDRALGGYFTVLDLRGIGAREDFHIKGYSQTRELLLHTWHIGEASMQMECAAWRSRGAVERKS